MAIQIIFNNLLHSLVAARQQAHRPIGAEHQALWPERVENHVQVRLEILSLPVMPIGFGHESREFAINIRTLRNVSHVRGPGRGAARFDFGLRQMIYYESLFREPGDKFQRGGQLLRINENVVSKYKFPQARNPPHKIVPHQESLVGFRLRNVPEAAQLFKLREKCQPLGDLRRAKITPANDARNTWAAVRESKQKLRFSFRLVRLDGDRGVDSVGLTLAVQILR